MPIRLCLLALLLLVPWPAWAHAVLLDTMPAEAASLPEAPDAVVLRFNEPVRPVALRLFDGNGRELAGTCSIEIDGERLRFRLPPGLADGRYVLSWHVTSLDSHPIGGSLRFAIGVPMPAGPAPPVEPAASWPLTLAMHALHDTATVVGVGAVLFLLLVPVAPAPAQAIQALAAWTLPAAVLLTVARLGLSGMELAGLRAADLLTAAPWTVALGLPIGRSLMVQALGLALLLPVARATVHTTTLAAIRLAGLALVLAATALTGHAVTAGPFWLTAPALVLHGLAATFWLGSLLPLVLVLRGPEPRAEPLEAFARLALVLVPLLVLAGTAMAVLQLRGVGALATTAYGRLLASKLALAAALLAAAAVNRRILMPRLRRGDPRAVPGLRRTLGLDLALGLAVLALTAGLATVPPPRALEATAPPERSLALSAHGHLAVLTLRPGTIGLNRAELLVAGPDGKVVPGKAATLRASLPEAGLEPLRLQAVATDAGGWTVGGLDLLRPGRWALRLDLLVDDFTQLRFATELRVDP